MILFNPVQTKRKPRWLLIDFRNFKIIQNVWGLRRKDGGGGGGASELGGGHNGKGDLEWERVEERWNHPMYFSKWILFGVQTFENEKNFTNSQAERQSFTIRLIFCTVVIHGLYKNRGLRLYTVCKNLPFSFRTNFWRVRVLMNERK